MDSENTTPTLFEDWQARQRYLLNNPGEPALVYRDVQLQILEFLLKRYRETAEAQRPARFPLPKEMVWNRRVQVVHRSLAMRRSRIIRDEQEARDRIAPLLARMASLNVQADAGPPAKGALGFDDALRDTSDLLMKRLIPSLSIQFHGIAAYDVDEWLAAFRNMLPERQLDVLRGHFGRAMHYKEEEDPAGRGGFAQAQIAPTISLEFLKRCGHPDALGYLILLWKAAIADREKNDLRDHLEAHFETIQASAADHLRFELANAESRVRLRAVRWLGRVGSLDDIGLLSDLLMLPRQGDEAPTERDALLNALVAISRRNNEGT